MNFYCGENLALIRSDAVAAPAMQNPKEFSRNFSIYRFQSSLTILADFWALSEASPPSPPAVDDYIAFGSWHMPTSSTA